MSELVLYRKMYFQLFHDVTCALAALDTARSEAKNITGVRKEEALEKEIEHIIISLRKAQQKSEQIYMEDVSCTCQGVKLF